MGILENLFPNSKKIDPLSQFGEKIKGLKRTQRIQFEWLTVQYKKISQNKKDGGNQLNAFLKRFEKARKDKENISAFLDLEEEALNTYLKKKESLKNKDSENTLMEEDLVIPVQQKTTTDIWDKIKKYERVFIHEKASPVVEHLYGAMIRYVHKYKEGILKTTTVVDSNEYYQLVSGLIYSLEDLTSTKGQGLPFVFAKYSFELDRESRDHKNLEKEVMIKISNILNKAKKIILWSSSVKESEVDKGSYRYILVDNRQMEFHEFFRVFDSDTQKIISAFNLQSWS